MNSLDPLPVWNDLFDDLVPHYVCQNFLPPKQRGRSDRSFNQRDFNFFSESVIELSELFTIERQRNRLIHHYFDHPRFQSAYLLYYFPLQAFKFFRILTKNIDATQKALGSAKQPLRILDLGAGPGTASVGMLQALLAAQVKLPKIEFHWVDQNQKIMVHGEKILRSFISQNPNFFKEVPEIILHRADVFQRRGFRPPHVDWILSGNFFNEERKDSVTFLRSLISETGASHLLSVEPAMKFQSHALSALRNDFFENSESAKTWSIVSPCLHQERCPLSIGRDWCHFSEPAKIPGRWLRNFSELLGSERSFLKYSHLWLSKGTELIDLKERKSMKRVVSDPIRLGGKKWKILLCQPESPQNFLVDSVDRPRIHRGDLIRSNRSK